MKKVVGKRIKRIREDQKIHRDDVADELKLSNSAYSKIERGETDVQVTRLYEIAKILKVNVTDFFQDKKESSFFEDNFKDYGFATKHDVEQLAHSIQKLFVEFEKLKNKMESANKKPARKKK